MKNKKSAVQNATDKVRRSMERPAFYDGENSLYDQKAVDALISLVEQLGGTEVLHYFIGMECGSCIAHRGPFPTPDERDAAAKKFFLEDEDNTAHGMDVTLTPGKPPTIETWDYSNKFMEGEPIDEVEAQAEGEG
jgi:hypothetical protein